MVVRLTKMGSHGWIGDSGAYHLGEAFKKVPKLAVLSFVVQGNPIGDNGAKGLAAALWHLPELPRCILGCEGTTLVTAVQPISEELSEIYPNSLF